MNPISIIKNTISKISSEDGKQVAIEIISPFNSISDKFQKVKKFALSIFKKDKVVLVFVNSETGPYNNWVEINSGEVVIVALSQEELRELRATADDKHGQYLQTKQMYDAFELVLEKENTK